MPLQWMMSWVFLTAIAAGAVRADSVKDGGRVLFVGAGWTEQHGYAAMAEAAVLLRYPQASLMFRNIGRTGDRPDGAARGGMDKLLAEIIAFEPTHVVVGYPLVLPANATDSSVVPVLHDFVMTLRKKEWHVVLVSPIWDPGWPAERVRRYEAVRAEVLKLTQADGVRLADPMSSYKRLVKRWRPTEPFDPVFPPELVHRVIAQSVYAALTGELADSFPPLSSRPAQGLMAKIKLRDEAYVRRTRPQDETYIVGRRRHEQGKFSEELAALEEAEQTLRSEMDEIRRAAEGSPTTQPTAGGKVDP